MKHSDFDRTGDPHGVDCPWCGAFIRDLWDGNACNAGTEWDCPHCEKPLKTKDVFTTVVVGRNALDSAVKP